MTEEQLFSVHPSRITTTGMNARNRTSFSEKDPEFKGLIDSIARSGIIEPLIVTDSEEGKEMHYDLVAGERRLSAAIKLDLPEIPVIYKPGLDRDQIYDLMNAENLHRKNLDPLEEAKSFSQYVNKYGDEGVEDLAQRLNVRAAYVRKRLAFLELPKKALKMWKKGQLKTGHLEILCRFIDNPETMNATLVQIEDIVSEGREVLSLERLKQFAMRLATKLSCAKFNIKKECATCHSNSVVQMNLFSIDGLETAECFKTDCFMQKQREHIEKYWKQTKAYRLFRTTGFMFQQEVSYGDFDTLYFSMNKASEDKKCFSCEHYISLIYNSGDTYYDRVCYKGNQACFNVQNKDTVSKKTVKADGTVVETRIPRNHGPEFRDIFFLETIPDKLKDHKPGSELIDRLTLFSMIKENSALHSWFNDYGLDIEKVEEDDDHRYFHMLDSEIWAKIESLSAKGLKNAIKEAVVTHIQKSNYYLENRTKVAEMLGTDIKKEWVMTEEWLKKKRIFEILEHAKKFKVFNKKAVKDHIVSNKYPVEPEKMKKKELIDCYLHSGIELSNMVPKELIDG